MVYEGLIMVANASVAAANASAMGQIQSAKYNMLGQIGSSFIGSIGSLFGAKASSKDQYKYQSRLQKQAAKLNYEYAEKTARNSPTWNRAGLETAGYNPMLAVQNSTSGANSSWTSPGQATAPDYVGAISQGVSNAQSFQRLKNETDQSESVTDANYATADKLKAEKAEISARLPFVSKRQRAEIAKLEADSQLAEAQKHNLTERLELDRTLGLMGIDVKQTSNANDAERNDIERKGNPFRSFRDFGDKYHWSPRQFGQELGRRYAKDHFGRFYKGQ